MTAVDISSQLALQ